MRSSKCSSQSLIETVYTNKYIKKEGINLELTIDCHTHIVSREIRDEYFARVDNRYALVMQFPASIMKNSECLETVESDRRLFLCPSIDLNAPITHRLKEIEKMLTRYQIVGLKIYLTYQRGKADDPPLFPVYEFAARHRLSVTFHTGLCSLVLPSDDDMDGSDARYIGHAAELYPEVNFIAAHMDDPRFDSCMEVVSTHKNVFTDISGAYETGTSYGADVDAAIDLFKKSTDKYPEAYTQMLYGTDFCPPIKLGQLDEYDYSLDRMFLREYHSAIRYDNALRAFPRIAEFL